jgi:hypothetical protein
MTLIATTLNKGVPILLGDLLITSKTPLKAITLPTNNDPNNQSYLKAFKDKIFTPIGLYQKLYIIKQNLCVALAGDVNEMKAFLKEMNLRFSYFEEYEIDENKIIGFMKDIDVDKNFKNCAFVIMILQPRNDQETSLKRIFYPKHLWQHVKSNLFDTVSACGSGSADFIKYIKKKDIDPYKTDTEIGTINSGIMPNIGLIAELLAVERITFKTLLQSWGGGFETILCNGATFMKYPDITFVIYASQKKSSDKYPTPFPQQVLHYRYHNSYLMIYSIDILEADIKSDNQINKMVSTKFKTKIYLVPRIDVESTNVNLPTDISFISNNVAHGFGLINEDENSLCSLTTAFSYSIGDSDQIVVFEPEVEISITIKSEFVESITDYAIIPPTSSP